MEENKKDVANIETKSLPEKKKGSFIIPVLFAVVLIILGYSGYVYYQQLNSKPEEPVAETDNKTDQVSSVEQQKPKIDNTIINGTWKSENRDDGKWLEFSINYPDATMLPDGAKWAIKKVDDNDKHYQYALYNEVSGAIFYISDLDGDAALIWYCSTGNEYDSSLKLNRTERPEPETAVVDAPAETNTASNTNGNNNSSNNKPSENTGNNKPPASNSGNSSSSSNPKGHYEERQVCVQEAYDEQVLVKKGECTNVLVKEAYDSQEMVYLEGAYYGPDREVVLVCNQCGEIWTDEHMSETHRSWHNESRDISEPYWHNVEYRTIHHDAVYETQCEPDEYKTVHHDAVYETQMVWVED